MGVGSELGSFGANQITYATNVAAHLSQVYLWDPSSALSQDPDVYGKMLRDPVISGALDHLQRLVVGHRFAMTPAEDTPDERRLAGVVEALTRRCRGLPQAFYNLSRATFMGAAWALMFPERRVLKIGDGRPREWTVIARLRDVDKRRFRLSRIHAPEPAPGIVLGSTPRASFNAGSVGTFQWEFHRGYDYADSSPQWWGPLSAVAPDERWVQHVPDNTERGLGYGYGLADDLYFYFWAKQQIWKYGLQGLERWGQGFLYAKVKALRDGFAKGSAQSPALTATVNALRTWRSENFAAVDADTDLQLLDMPATAEASCRSWIDYIDGEIVKRILAALQPTGGSKGEGSYSSSKVEEGSTDSMVAYLRSLLEETWTHTFVTYLIEHNQENIRELGLDGLELCRLSLRGKEIRDLDQVCKVFDLAARLGMPVKRSEFYDWTGLSTPTDDDTVTFAEAQEIAGAAGAGAVELGGESGHDQLARLLEGAGAEQTPVGEGGTAVGELAQARGRIDQAFMQLWAQGRRAA